MPRFFFDTDDGEHQFHDEKGIDLASRDDVPGESMGLLRDLAYHELPLGCHTMAVKVRDARDALIYRATMTIVGQRHE